MDSRRSPVTETAATTTDTTTTTAETPPAPKRDKGTTTDGVKAGQLFEKLTQLDADEAAELANAPASIRARFEERRQKELSKASESVRKLVEKLRAP
jgi:hypothetical protein